MVLIPLIIFGGGGGLGGSRGGFWEWGLFGFEVGRGRSIVFVNNKWKGQMAFWENRKVCMEMKFWGVD